MGDEPKLVLIPGMGVDERLFVEQRAAFPGLVVPAWIEPRKREPLEEYARRLAATVRVDGPYYLGGVSMGGMIALEMAKLLNPAPRAVFMVASCRGCSVIPGPMYALECVSRVIPSFVIGLMRRQPRFVLGKVTGLSAEQLERFMTMYAGSPIAFVRWAGWAVLHWTFRGELAMPVHHIHGEHDGLMPIGRVKADEVVRGGGHLINMTHADQVNRFIRERMA